MEIKIEEMGKNTVRVKIKGETHTLCNLIRVKAYDTDKVEFIGYSIPHPLLEESEISLKTKENYNPIDTLQETTEYIINELKKLKEKVKNKLTTK